MKERDEVFEHRATIGHAMSLARDIGDMLMMSDTSCARDKAHALVRYLHERGVELPRVHPLDDPTTPAWQRQLWVDAKPLGRHRQEE
jgi:hypothetical protein